MDDDVSDMLARRRARRRRKQTTILVLAAGGLAVAAVVVAAVLVVAAGRRGAVAGGTRAAPTRPDEGRGGFVIPGIVPPTQTVTGPGTLDPATKTKADGWTYREMHEHLRAKGLRVRFDNYEGDTYFANESYPRAALGNLQYGVGWDEVVKVQQLPTPEIARRVAGQRPDGTYNYGVWLFTSSNSGPMLPAIRKALED